MVNIIPFESKLPTYLKAVNISEINADLTAHAGGGFPVISIKGKAFSIVRDGERTVIPNPRDPESPATSIEIVIIKANKNISKVFYLRGYDKEASEGQKPDCYSNDGVAPAPDAQSPQSKKCATCPHNQWGSRVTDKGTSKGKACSDVVRLAVAPAGQLNDPMLLRVPPASIRALGEYGQMLAKRGVAYNAIVTKIGFDPEAESPKLTFKPVGFLDEDGYNEVKKIMNTDIVRDILGGHASSELKAPEQLNLDLEPPAIEDKANAVEVEKPAAKPIAKKTAEKSSKASAPDVDDDIDLDIDGIDFDD